MEIDVSPSNISAHVEGLRIIETSCRIDQMTRLNSCNTKIVEPFYYNKLNFGKQKIHLPQANALFFLAFPLVFVAGVLDVWVNMKRFLRV